MKKGFFTGLLLIAILALTGISSASAQDAPYLFEVNKTDVNVYWNADGTMSLEYTWTFTNQPNSHPIDFVDVGMPSYYYDISSVTADVDGAPVSVSKGDYAGNGSGFAVVMGNKTIPAGGRGTVHVYVGNITQVLREDTSDQNYASAVFGTTWFGSQYVTGSSDYTVTFFMPPGMQSDEPRWHDAPSGFPSTPQGGYDDNDRIYYRWHNPNGTASKAYQFGASFPRSYVPADSIYVPPPAPLIDPETLSTLSILGCFGFIFFGIPMLTVIGNRRRKMQYLPPRISIEGHGIKRGLTAVEAAILLEQPLDKIMTMILFGVLKKDAAKVTMRDPLELQVHDPISEDLHDYEKTFLKAFKLPAGRERQGKLQEMMVVLVRTVSAKMKGFSRRETVNYYKTITEKAWAQVERADTPEVKSQKFDEALEWTMLDKNYDDRTRRVFRGPIIVPMWWGRYDPTYRTGSSVPRTVSTSPGTGRTSTSLPGADFAAQMVIGVQTFSQKVVGNINTFTEKITKSTNPVPKTSSSARSGRGGGGGRSCACACACAGCACACAGGGR